MESHELESCSRHPTPEPSTEKDTKDNDKQNDSVHQSTGNKESLVEPTPQATENGHEKTEGISKNQLKRQLKRERILAERPAKRQAEKARKKLKRLEQSKLQSQTPPKTQDDHRKLNQPTQLFRSTILFDCSFDDKMSEKEVMSLDCQLAHSYSVNRKSNFKFQKLICASFNGKLQQRFQSNGNQHLNWKSFQFTSEPISSLVSNPPTANSLAALFPSKATNPPSSSSNGDVKKIEPINLIYLTADSPNVLETIDEDKVYIIGAIVDHNRHKNLCLNLAIKQGFHHAQLPIGQYMSELKTRKVLTVNQVMEIMVSWLSERDWRKSFEQVIPLRKLAD
ncbi:hypothetical protein O181_027704 [Austropuccinia psidii MF-1]|uniref:tRNA (guanine(9)-N1)-methyltransferase n=1 Tax=Austropuccinia psidii MF-1 TaxID=1389203 RepID=A0A9Q3H2V5_9BASI|nr:hypothetical protein [Austropuccinia psidii MF-1]